jgi:hypothetical protein
MELSKAKEKLELAEIEARLERLVEAEQEYQTSKDKLFELGEDEYTEENRKALKQQAMSNHSIPHGVAFLGGGLGWIAGDTKLFIRFSTWWIQGAMTSELFDLFHYHYEEIIELDYGWVLTDRPSFHYSPEAEPEDFHRRIEMLKEVGIRDSKRNKCINFKLSIGHGDYIRGLNQ